MKKAPLEDDSQFVVDLIHTAATLAEGVVIRPGQTGWQPDLSAIAAASRASGYIADVGRGIRSDWASAYGNLGRGATIERIETEFAKIYGLRILRIIDLHAGIARRVSGSPRPLHWSKSNQLEVMTSYLVYTSLQSLYKELKATTPVHSAAVRAA